MTGRSHAPSVGRARPMYDYSRLMSPNLLLENQRRLADSCSFELDVDFNAIGNLGNTAVHSVVLTIEGHRPFNLARACPFAGHRKGQSFWF
jgi:hypothetical protein